jgi:hypothetical protein
MVSNEVCIYLINDGPSDSKFDARLMHTQCWKIFDHQLRPSGAQEVHGSSTSGQW